MSMVPPVRSTLPSLPAASSASSAFIMTRTYFIYRHVCDGGDVGCRFRRIVRSNMSILQGRPTTICAPERSLCDRGAYPCQIGAQRRKPLLSTPSLRVAARTVGCCVTLLDPIDIGPWSGALHPVRPGHNASRAYI